MVQLHLSFTLQWCGCTFLSLSNGVATSFFHSPMVRLHFFYPFQRCSWTFFFPLNGPPHCSRIVQLHIFFSQFEWSPLFALEWCGCTFSFFNLNGPLPCSRMVWLHFFFSKVRFHLHFTVFCCKSCPFSRKTKLSKPSPCAKIFFSMVRLHLLFSKVRLHLHFPFFCYQLCPLS